MQDLTTIDSLYEAAVVPDRWSQILRNLSLQVDATDGLIISNIGPRVEMLGSSERFISIGQEFYARFGPDNLRTKRALQKKIPEFVVDEDLLSESEIREEPLYKDFLVPEKYGRFIATHIDIPDGDTILVHFEGDRRDGPFSQRARDHLNALRPHMSRAAVLAARFGLQQSRMAVATLELIGLPAAVLSHAGQAVTMNDLFAAMVPGRFQDRRARLMAVDTQVDTVLNNALASIAELGFPAPVGSIALPAAGTFSPAALHLVPIKGLAHDLFSRGGTIAIVTSLGQINQPPEELVQALFDLTPTEARLVNAVAGGNTLKEISLSENKAETTTRQQLKQAMAKLGVSRQLDIANLLNSISSPVRLD